MRRLAALLPALALAACAPEPQEAHPALWSVMGHHGEQAFLFGTIHSLDRPAQWRTGEVDHALRSSDRIVVEIADLLDDQALTKTFAELARSPGLPPLSARLPAALRPRLAEVLRKDGMQESQFAEVETWAVALTLARAGAKDSDTAYGIDRAVLASAEGKPVVELEGAARQLGIFDRLSEKEQADLLAAVLRDADSIESESGSLAGAWRRGDMQVIEAETHKGLLADPELREALFAARNRAWSDKLAAMLARGAHPFVAVGAAHMAGPEGLPALLVAKGYQVTRIQ